MSAKDGEWREPIDMVIYRIKRRFYRTRLGNRWKLSKIVRAAKRPSMGCDATKESEAAG